MRRKTYLILACALTLCLAATGAHADTFVGTNTGVWTALPAMNNDGSPFFDNVGDGSGNVGALLQPGGPYSNPAMDYWSLPVGLKDTNVSFINDGAPESAFLMFERAGNAGSNSLYIYDVTDPTQTTLVFAGGDAPGTTKAIPVTYGQYGFLLTGPGGSFYSTPGVSGATSDGNFAFFAPTGSYTGSAGTYTGNVWYIGVEDLPLGNSDLDYNDMIFKVTNVPLPPSALLLGTGLLGLAGLGWRRRKAKV